MRNPALASLNNPAIVSDSFTRPANTTAYAAGDVIADSTTAPTAQSLLLCTRKEAGYAKIIGASLLDSAAQATAGQFEAWLFNAAVALDNDNAAFTPTDAEMATLVAVIPFYDIDGAYNFTGPATASFNTVKSFDGDATAGAGGNRIITIGMDKLIKCATASRTLYWFLVARNAYTPVSGETFTLTLDLMRD